MPDALIHLRLSAARKGRWVRESRADGLRLTDWIINIVEQHIMKSQITVTAIPGGYRMEATGKHGAIGGTRVRDLDVTPARMAAILRWEIGKQKSINPEGCDFVAPPEVIAALESGPLTGKRISYYASAEAWDAIQAKREATGDSQSGAINALVLRNAEFSGDAPLFGAASAGTKG